MASENFASALKHVLAHEGGYVDHPLDPGGATNRGITRATLSAHRGRPVSKAEVMALGLDETATIYRTGYWDRVRADELPAGVDLVVFDAAVNSGPARAIRWLQNAAGVAADGVIGSDTLAAVRRAEPGDIVTAIMRQRLAFLQRLRTWPSFGKGWGRRVRAIETAALAMAGQGVATSSARPGASIAMNDTKSLLTSRTLWSNLVGLTAVMASLFGLDMSGVDSAGLSQAIPQAVAAVSFIASTIFRVTATKRIAMP